MQINDEILRATGGPTINDGLASWYGMTASETLNDAEMRWLLSQAGTTTGTINDLWFEFLSNAPNSFTGALNDMKLLYWSSQP